jgi:hypothetical protein
LRRWDSTCRFDLHQEIEEWVGPRAAVSSRGDFIAKLGPLEDRPEWPEAIYPTVPHTDVVYTIETPKPFPIKAHIAAVETLMKALKE